MSEAYVYTLEQIKAAYLRAFHKSGEQWVEFMEELQKERDKVIEADPHPGAWEPIALCNDDSSTHAESSQTPQTPKWGDVGAW